MIKYTIAMSIRVACIFAMLFVDGWWLAVCAAGAIFLPYVAVVLANVNAPNHASQVLRPGGLVSQRPTDQTSPSPGPEHDEPRRDEPRRDDPRRDAAGHDDRGAA